MHTLCSRELECSILKQGICPCLCERVTAMVAQNANPADERHKTDYFTTLTSNSSLCHPFVAIEWDCKMGISACEWFGIRIDAHLD